MSGRIYNADEARALRDLVRPGYRFSDETVTVLCASVEHHAARADAAEARIETAEAREERATLERDAAQRALANVVAERDTVSADLHRVTMERDGARDLAQEAQEARIEQSLELAEARAEVVRLRAALDAAHRLVRRHGNAVDAMEEGREAEESAT